MHSRLRRADELVRADRIAEAVALYDVVAGEFERTGFALRAIAVSRQIVALVGDTTELVPTRLVALRRLARLYSQLGLMADAIEAERLLQIRPADRLH